MFAYCANNPTCYYDPSGHAQKYADIINRCLSGGSSVGLDLAIAGVGTGLGALINQFASDISRFVANTNADLKQLSRTLVDSAKKRWDDSQPCIHHVVPQGCTCESANKARELIKGNVQSVNNQVIINYETHRAIHANGHAYCTAVYTTLETNGVDRGMRLLKLSIFGDAISRGGVFLWMDLICYP